MKKENNFEAFFLKTCLECFRTSQNHTENDFRKNVCVQVHMCDEHKPLYLENGAAEILRTVCAVEGLVKVSFENKQLFFCMPFLNGQKSFARAPAFPIFEVSGQKVIHRWGLIAR